MRRIFHTPEGVRDIYGKECEKKLYLQHKLQKVFHAYGYHDIETPTFEYFDVFGTEIGTTPSRELYKFFDREGDTLVLRPDFTPSIARAASMYFHEEDLPIRLCYHGNTFVNNSSYQGRLKESTQMGVELIGDPSVDADGEVIALIVHLLKETGLKDFQISIGQVDFFKSLVEEAGLSEEATANLRQLISNKNYFGVEELIRKQNISKELEQVFTMLPQLFGSREILTSAKNMTSNPSARIAIERLEELHEVLVHYHCEEYVSYDLGMLSKYTYYTGIIFQGYTYGTGEPLVKGGRYNQLLAHFGNPAPAIGFGLYMDQILNALSRQKIDIPIINEKTLIVYKDKYRSAAIKIAMEHRNNQMNVQCMKAADEKIEMDYVNYGKQYSFSELIFPISESEIKIVNLFTDEETIMNIENFR